MEQWNDVWEAWTRLSEVKPDVELEVKGSELENTIMIHTYIAFAFLFYINSFFYFSFISFFYLYKDFH